MKVITNRTIFVIVQLLLLTCFAKGQQNFGLLFNSFNVPQEDRTSFSIGEKNPVCFDKGSEISLSFDFSFASNQHTYFGYLLRMANTSGQNINFIYDQGSALFRLTADGAFTGMNFSLPDDVLYRKWTNIKLILNKGTLALYINQKLFSKTDISLKDYSFRITYGSGSDGNFTTTDVPPMLLRNVKLSENGKAKYYWPLRFSDSSGVVYDSIHQYPARVINPVWASALHTNWQLLKTATYKGNASAAFDEKNEKLYIVSEDSVYRISFNGDTAASESFASRGYHLFSGNRSVYNTVDNTLYNYYVDIQSIAGYSFETGTWDKKYDYVEHTNYSQANRLFVPQDNALYIFGGYGQQKYKNKVQRYSFPDKKWNDSLQVKGDYFTPRYLAAGAQVGDSIYILGGYGSHTGDQMLNPDYVYDLMRYDIKNQTFKKVYTLPKPDSSMVFGCSMVIDSVNQCYYAFCFSNERSDSRLQLVRGSLIKPEYELLASPIPYHFHDILSCADLFYCPLSQKLLAVTFMTTLDKEVKVNIYSISFPPDILSAKTLPAAKRMYSKLWLCFVFAVLLMLAGFAVFFMRKKRKRVILAKDILPSGAEQIIYTNETVEEPEIIEQNNRQAIHLFGAFEMKDKTGTDLSEHMSPLLKELFLVILLNSLDNKTGVSSEKLNEMFWHEKSEKDANNNRSVNIAKLKNILEKLGSITIKKSAGKWLAEYDASEISIDLVDFLDTASSKQKNIHAKAGKMLSILSRGSFLSQTEYNWLDNIKSDVSNKVIDELLDTSKLLDSAKDADLMVKIANAIFYFDPVNEDAIHLKCKSLALIGRHSLSKSCYEHFSREYEKMYGETFSVPFSEMTAS